MAHNAWQGTGSIPSSSIASSPAQAATKTITKRTRKLQYSDDEDADTVPVKLYCLTLSDREFKWLKKFPGGLYTKVENPSDEIKVVSTMSLNTAKELQEWKVSWTSKAFGGILHSDDGLLESKFVVEIGATFKASSESEQILLNVTRNESKLWALSKVNSSTNDDLEAYFDSLKSGEMAIMMANPSGERYESGPWKLGTLSLKGYYRSRRTAVTTEPFKATFTIVELPHNAGEGYE